MNVCVRVCVSTHATDNEMYILFTVFQMPFSKPVIVPRVTKLFPFLFITLGNGNLSRVDWEKMKEKGRDGFPSCKEK